LSIIDNATTVIDSARKKIPGLSLWAMFVRTPMNFAKQWMEYFPVSGAANLIGSTRKKEQIAKMMIGSAAMYMGYQAAVEGKTTWGVPSDPDAKKTFLFFG